MTKLVELALTKAAELPDAEQDRMAQLVLEEIEDEGRWQATFAASQDKLSALAPACASSWCPEPWCRSAG
jgi:hypothetical protein